ncbi:MAG: metallophosphoesterase [Chroococcales cyanobacterium]
MFATSPSPTLLTDPFLLFPTANSIQVVWFTEFPGSSHHVRYGQNLTDSVEATTTLLSRTREDKDSQVMGKTFDELQRREIWRHEAVVTGLTPGNRIPYQVTSVREDGQRISSREFTLSATPQRESSLKILLTSDHQLKPMTSANLQKVSETIDKLDAIFFAGDLVNIPDRASEWFDDSEGNAFFPTLQGHGHYSLTKNGITTVYKGGEFIQNTPLFITIGNHEVMGRHSNKKSLNEQFDDSIPRQIAQELSVTPLEKTELKNASFNTDTVQEIFSLPEKNYYAVTFGDIRLVVLYATNMWRSPSLADNAKGKYRERKRDLDIPKNWGYGQHIFEPIAKGSEQYSWLEKELNSAEFQSAKYKIVMLHHPPHSLGENSVPAYTNPQQVLELDEEGKIKAVRYEYPQDADYLVRDIVPLLEEKGVQLVFYGHSHLWNRFKSPRGMHFLETSNVGNSYGAYLGENKRKVPENYQESYAAVGNPNGLDPIVPAIAPLRDENGNPQPYIASNDITAFSIFDTETGMISSYYFDTRSPNSPVIKFDEFSIIQS